MKRSLHNYAHDPGTLSACGIWMECRTTEQIYLICMDKALVKYPPVQMRTKGDISPFACSRYVLTNMGEVISQGRYFELCELSWECDLKTSLKLVWYWFLIYIAWVLRELIHACMKYLLAVISWFMLINIDVSIIICFEKNPEDSLDAICVEPYHCFIFV